MHNTNYSLQLFFRHVSIDVHPLTRGGEVREGEGEVRGGEGRGEEVR